MNKTAAIPDIIALFDIDVENGRFFWKHPHRFAGREAGGICDPLQDRLKPYWQINIKCVTYKRGRLMFAYIHGRWPAPCLDHIDGDSLNDRPSNLREASRADNARNVKKSKRPKHHLPMGVRLMTHSSRYRAVINCDGKYISLGGYATPEEASAAYRAKRTQLFGDFA